MKKRKGIKPKPQPPRMEDIRSMLADIDLPGNLSEFIESLTRRSRSILRLRRGVQLDDLPWKVSSVAWYELAKRLDDQSRPAPSHCLPYFAGDYYLQDSASLLALAAMDADRDKVAPFSEGPLVCDLCAAPGGKASAMLEALGDSGFLLANEVIRSRMTALRVNLARTGSNRYAISSKDPNDLADLLTGVFDLVLVDAPCSGQALVAKGKQQTASFSQRQIEHSVSRQERILDAACRLVRDGGRLIYSTCTFATAENESQVSRLVEAGRAETDSDARLAAYASADGCYRLWPHVHDCGGSFAGSLVVSNINRRGSRSGGKQQRTNRTSREVIEAIQWYRNGVDGLRVSVRDAVALGWPDDAPGWVDSIACGGPEVAYRTGQTWKPSHAAALARHSSARPSQTWDVDDAGAEAYLMGGSIPCSQTGWTTVQWRTRPLGWIKGVAGEGKNQLPAAARLTRSLGK